jgi:NodT family efflux transporter outer membrane factor (OMF) lipoprotein
MKAMSVVHCLSRSLHGCMLLAAALLAGCAVGPDYVRPALSLPDRYTAGPTESEAAASGVPSGTAGAAAAATPAGSAEVPVQQLSTTLDIPAEWWGAFHSEPLNAWVQASLAHNPNVEAAQAALRAAQENALAESAAFWPQVALNYTPTRQKIADTIASPVSSNATLYNLHTAQVTVNYVPDVFGGTRRAAEAARAQTEQERFQLEATYLTLSANVVNAAITEAALRAQRDATEAIIAEQKDVLASYRRQQALGNVALADVDAQEAALANTEATLPPLDKQLGVQRNLLATLAGRYPSERKDSDTHFELATLVLPTELPLTLPADLVEHRPDVRAAEANLHAASAGIGVAVAARLPNVQLGVNAYGSQAYSFSQLFNSDTIFWTLAASITQPVFDGGALKHREGAARAAFDQAAAQYRATVLSAFQDVANALQAIDADTHALNAALIAEHATAKSLERARAQWGLGDTSALAVLQAQQAWQQAVLNLAQARGARLSDTAALFQALGGGWWNRPDHDAVAAAPAAH